ncbi:MAG: radical SAM protein [Candidatus Pacebacteria bacterium]|nr:radical SAM protein [Candidatus Paceibacterota bacterium]
MEKLFIPNRFIFQWHITERCNWRCRHCYQEHTKMPKDLTLDQLFHIFDQFLFLIKKWQLSPQKTTLSIAGGEPLVREDFLRLIKKIGQYSHLYFLCMLTNGSLLTDEKIKCLKDANINIVQVSLEGEKKRNDEIRAAGSFERTINSIKLLVKNEVPVAVSLTLTRKNMGDVFSLVKTLEDIGVVALATRRLIPLGRGESLKKYMLQPDELKRYYLRVKRENEKLFKKGSRIRLMLVCDNAIFNDELLKNPIPNMNTGLCSVTEGRGLFVMANGDILPCRRLPLVVGNALNDNFLDVFYSQKMKDLRNLNKINYFCQKCSSFSSCFGGARCVNYAYTGEWNIPDIQCWRANKKINDFNF